MGRKIAVSLGEYFQNFVESKISEGRYKNASEVIRAGLQLLEEEERRFNMLRDAIDQGISSGIESKFDSKRQLEKLKNSIHK